MIVAHPDDETLFGGGELIQHASEYKVVVLDYGNHMVRHREFIKAMEMIGVGKWEHWDGEPYKSSAAYNESVLIPLIERVLNEREWTKVVTHNQGGEYGHYRHVSTHNVMARLCPDKLWVFDMGTEPTLNKEAEGDVQLQAAECKTGSRWQNPNIPAFPNLNIETDAFFKPKTENEVPP